MKQATLFADPGPADPAALSAIAAHAIPRATLAATHTNLLKSTDLFAHGYSVSHWVRPGVPGSEVLEFNPRAVAGEANDLPRLTAATYEQQKAIHEALGARVVGPGEEYDR